MPIKQFKRVTTRDRPSASEWNRMTRMIESLTNALMVYGYIDNSGVLIRRQPAVTTENYKIFEVQSAATGDGVYTCWEQVMDSTNFDSTSNVDKFADKNEVDIEVFNLQENYCFSTYSPALAKLDLIMAWKTFDDEGIRRWIGIPMAGRIRTAKFAITPTGIAAAMNIIGRDGVELTSGLGAGLTVYPHCNGTADFDDAIPRYVDDGLAPIYNEQGKWYTADTLQLIDDTKGLDIENDKLKSTLFECEEEE